MKHDEGLIIGVGFQKTGTKSLRAALQFMGYRVRDTSKKVLFPILRGNYKKVLKMLEGYDAVGDTPWYMIYQKLDELVPNSKFILTIRDEEAWYRSVSKHIGNVRTANHEWIYGRGKGLPKDHKENTINVYRKHNEGVLEYFKDRPQDLLVVDFTKGDGWEELCAFLNQEVPDEPFPHRNQTADKVNKKISMGRSLLRRYKHLVWAMQLRYINLTGLWDQK